MRLIIDNNDIMSEVLKHVSYTSIVKTSIISKYFLEYYKKLSLAERDMLKYDELDKSIIKYSSAIVEETCNKYKYTKPKFIRYFNNFLVSSINSELEKKFVESRNLYILADMLIIKTHLINRNYNAILQKLEKINYACIEKIQPVLEFILKILNSSSKKRWGRNTYSENTVKMMNIISHLFFFKVAENFAKKSKCISDILTVKKIQWYDYIEKNAKNYPRYFVEKLKKIL